MVLSDLDRDLLNRCLAGTDGAWEAFIDRYLALVTHVVLNTAKLRFEVVPDEVRDDMVAEILLAIVEDDFAVLRRFRGQSSLGTYLVVVARRIAARRLTKLSAIETPVDSAPQNGQSQADDVELNLENHDEVQNLLGKLPESEATAIRMYHLEHQSYDQIGNRLGIAENSVGPLLSKARQRLREMRET